MENNKQQQLIERVTLAISEHHSGNADEAKLIAQAALSILQPELQKRDEALKEAAKLIRISKNAAGKLRTMYIRGETSRRSELDQLVSLQENDEFYRVASLIRTALTATDTVQGGGV